MIRGHYMAAVRRFLYSLVLIAVLPCFLSAQDDGESGTHVTKTDEGLELSQIIAFPAVPNTLYYEVEIEQLAGNVFVSVDTVRTESNSVELSLKAGSYRYRISSYNVMNLFEGRSNWQDFRVLPAEQPEAETYQPFYGFYYELADPSGSIVVTGQGFYEESEFALVENDGDWSNINLDEHWGVLFPDQVTVSADHTRAEMSFIRKELKRGEYYIFIRNPGGLWTLLGQVRVGYRKNTDFTLSFGYSPMIALFDYTKAFKSEDSGWPSFIHTEEEKLNRFNWRGAYVRFGWIPVKTRLGNFGFEANLEFLADKTWDASENEGWNPFEFFSGGHFDLLYQKEFFEKWQLNVRIGAGGGEEYNEHDYSSGQTYEESYIPSILLNFGVSAQYFIWKNLYAEAGINFQYMLGVEHFMIRPGIGLGWQFGRWSEYTEVTKAQRQGEDPSVPVTDIPKSEFILSLGWAPMIPVYGINYVEKDHNASYSNPGSDLTVLRPFNPLGAYFRAAYIPYRWGKNKLGVEWQLYILEHANRVEWTNEEDVFYRYLDIVSTSHIGILYQRALADPWQLSVRLGGGISNPYSIEEDDSSSNNNNSEVEIPFSMGVGASVQYFFWHNLYAEAGLDFTMTFGRYTHSILRPTIGIGWQFNNNAETGLRPDHKSSF
jgi:hypothetical protein